MWKLGSGMSLRGIFKRSSSTSSSYKAGIGDRAHITRLNYWIRLATYDKYEDYGSRLVTGYKWGFNEYFVQDGVHHVVFRNPFGELCDHSKMQEVDPFGPSFRTGYAPTLKAAQRDLHRRMKRYHKNRVKYLDRFNTKSVRGGWVSE